MKETCKNLKKVYQYGKDYKASIIIQIICCIFNIAMHVVVPILSARFIIGFTNSKFEQAIFMAFIILLIDLFSNLNSFVIRKNCQIFRRGTVRNLQKALGKEILELDQKSLDSTSSGVFIQRLVGDTDNLAGMFTTGMGKCTGFISNIAAFVAIFIIDWHMFIYYFVASIILTVLYYIKSEKVGKKDIVYRKQSDKVAGLTGELIRGARDIKMLYAKDSFIDELDSNIQKQSELNFSMRNTVMGYNLFIDSLKNVFEFITIILLIYLNTKNYFSIAIAITLFNYRSTVLNSFMQAISSLLEECKDFNISADRVFSILDNIDFNKENFGNNHINKIDGNFEFKNVSFGYNNDLVINNLSFNIESGSTIGFVGKSGSGKTTIFNLLCKMYDIKSGEILIDGNNINDLDEESIRGNITIISQNPYIFNMSIKDNLKLVKNNLTDKEMKEACKLACLDEYIESLPDKYDTVVGEGGVNLSGGQRQRLAIARALIQKTKIILFDEATSALDNETQNKISNAIDNLKGKYTILIIAHRLSTIINCKKIFYIEKGQIIDSGTHTSLLKSCKKYKELYEYEIKDNK